MIRRRMGAASLVIALAASALALVAGGAGASASQQGGSCKSDPGITDTEIKVGGIIPTSGPSAQSFSAAQDGIQARFAKANAEGELGDRTLVFDVSDDAADTAKNLTAAQELVEQKGVFGVIEVSNASDASGQYLSDEGIPVTGWHLGNSAWGKYKNMFGWRNANVVDPAKEFTTRNADLVQSFGAKKIALVGTSAASSAVFISQLEQAMKARGVKIVYKTADLTAADRDFTAVAEKIKESGADSVYTGMDLIQNAALNQSLTQAGADLKIVVFPGGYDARAAAIPGMEGAIFSIEFAPFENNPPAFAEYEKWMTSDLPDKPFYGQVPYIGWLSAEAFIEGIKAAGADCPTRKAFIKNLRKVKNYTANDAFHPVDFAKVFSKPILCVYYVQVENAAFTPLFDGEPFCPKALLTNGKVTKLTAKQIKNG